MKRTVFVLGAGSSAMFGFPIGQGLCQLVCDELRADSQSGYGTTLRESTEFSDAEITRFCYELRMSAQSSVDAFLEHRREFLDLGKAAMAVILVSKEVSGNLWSGDANWMRYLFQRLNVPFEDFDAIPVSFITFNYDRSLEHFLYTALRHKYGKTEAECAAMLERIPIIHLHGRLGYLPWEKGKDRRPYDQVMNRLVLDMCINNIKVVHEDPKDGRDKDFERAYELMQKAECIYYLGFGFGAVNVERLKISSLDEKTNYGTGLGLTQKECVEASRRGGGLGKLNPVLGADCIRLLREYVDFT